MKENLPENPFTYKDLLKLGVSRYELQLMIKRGEVEKIGRGVFQLKRESEESEVFDTTNFKMISTLAGSKSYIGLWSALYFYDLTEEFIEQVWIFIPYEKIIRVSEAKIIRKRNFDDSVGVEKFEGFKMSSLERTLIDCFLHKRHVSLRDTLSFMKKAILEKKTSLLKINRLAREMGVFEKIQDKLELVA